MESVFCRDMCVAENTLRGASVELAAYSGQSRRRAQRSFYPKVACHFGVKDTRAAAASYTVLR